MRRSPDDTAQAALAAAARADPARASRSPEQAQAGASQPERAGKRRGRLLQADGGVVPGHQVGQYQLADAGPGRVLGRLPRRQVQVGGRSGPSRKDASR